jgi:hypothetical protein
MAAVTDNLAGLSRIMAGLSGAGLVIYPLMVAAAFLFPGSPPDWMMFQDHLGPMLNSAVPLSFRLAALGCALPQVALGMWALWMLNRIFRRYAAGDVFSVEALRHLNHIAVALFAQVIVSFAAQAPITYFLTFPLGHGHRSISLSFGSDDVYSLFVAGVMLVIARVMAVARRMADENESFV